MLSEIKGYPDDTVFIEGALAPAESAIPAETAKGISEVDERLKEIVARVTAGIAGTAETAGKADGQSEGDSLPCFYPALKDHMPSYLERIGHLADSDPKADVMLLSSLAAFSSCMTNCLISYNHKKYYPNLMVIITGNAASGKGTAMLARNLVTKMNKAKQAEAQIERQSVLESSREGSALPPKILTFIIPANSTSSAFTRAMTDNDGCGLIIESEMDTLSEAFNSAGCNFSSSFRRGYENEAISFMRVGDVGAKEVEKPKFSAVLSGTPSQVSRLIPNEEDGTFSRFLYYCLPPSYEFIVSINDEDDGTPFPEDEMKAIGDKFYEFLGKAGKKEEISFSVSKTLRAFTGESLQTIQDVCIEKYGDGLISLIHRMGSEIFKLSMVFAYLRMVDRGNPEDRVICIDDDFANAFAVAGVSFRHALQLYGKVIKKSANSNLGLKGIDGRKDRLALYEALPENFSRTELEQIVNSMPELTWDTVESHWLTDWVRKGLLERTSHGQYSKTKI